MALASLSIMPNILFGAGKKPKAATIAYPCRRPAAAERGFMSPAIEQCIARVKINIPDPKLAAMFENCFPSTLDTRVNFRMIDGKGEG